MIGEAVKQLPADLAPDKRQSTGRRSPVSETYFGVDVDILWDLIQNKLPTLEAAVPRPIGLPCVGGQLSIH